MAVVLPRGYRSDVLVLSTARRRPIATLLDQAAPGVPAASTMAWSADGRYLLTLFRGRLVVVDVRTGVTTEPDLGEDRWLQLALAPPTTSPDATRSQSGAVQ